MRYLGKRLIREGSLAKKEKICRATLQIISRYGVRGTTYRAVALEADLPLSSVVYYFDEVELLIHDAFIYHIDRSLKDVKIVTKHLGILCKQYAQEWGQSRQQLEVEMALLLLGLVMDILARPTKKQLELSLKLATFSSANINEAKKEYDANLTQNVAKAYMALNIDEQQAEYRAQLLIAYIDYLERKYLMKGKKKLLSKGIGG